MRLVKAQSFVDESHRWTYTLLSLVPNNIDSVTYEARFEGTQTIDGREYFEAFERITLDDDSDWMSMGHYRQEGSKVWFWDDLNRTDVLLYDFGLDSIGANFTFPNEWVPFGFDIKLELINIDSITLKNGELRKRQTFNVFSPPRDVFTTYWIEGIGSEDTPLFPFSLLDEDYDGGNRKLECFFSNEEHLLQQNPLGECAYLIGDVDDIAYSHNRFKIFPNPIRKGDPLHLSIDLPNLSTDLAISIYNTIGERIHQSTTRSTEPIFIDNNIDSGLYYCIITSDQTRYQITLIVID